MILPTLTKSALTLHSVFMLCVMLHRLIGECFAMRAVQIAKETEVSSCVVSYRAI
jgi:hypothetical protein